MKKKLCALVAAVMVLCLGTTCFAAPSSTTKTTTQTKGVTVSAAKEADVTSAKEAAKAKNLEVVDVFELTADTAVAVKEADGSYKVVLSLAGITASDNVKVLHFTGNTWEELAATAGNGTVTFNTKSFSPFAVVKVPAAAAPAGDKPASPKTGATVPVAGVVAIVAVAGLFVCTKKARA